ncbi:inorganic diphosphatase [Culicoidibacter larvae]|uniref:inorganic diphosphatase n=1 Tax=Culicoidibacter larvae TaxID=2579976 RepID=A0A5R8QC12_9FIRM|nr:inorganic diphosphatase [Culicoidibacter larvae]TLG73884.1 inorganic pyrophosphatase [Culicoidibacter larvae]
MHRHVDVIIDRALGYTDSYGTTYPINYGFVPGIIGGDGEEQDVYVLDVDKPIDRCSGKVIAIIHRRDDNETKWVIAKRPYTVKEIEEQVHFIEQYFDSYVELLVDNDIS